MGPSAPALPTRFPCWCRATYSWGGETKRDLGFIEGDLIECLNAGDGSWWMGRLRRDKRMVGLFPSNFVQVLEDDFRPNSRATSPLPSRNGSVSGLSTPTLVNGSSANTSPQKSPQKAVKSSFRKPFQAYARAGSPNPAAFSPARNSKSNQAPPAVQKAPHYTYMYRNTVEQNSPQHSRATSPQPNFASHTISRGPSPLPQDQFSSPPPPPPPHRTTYVPNGAHTSRAASPLPPSPGVFGNTPSPLRDAMEDVMSSLHDMGINRHEDSTESADLERAPSNPWSPESFGQIASKSFGRRERPRTSLGIAGEDLETESSRRFEARTEQETEDPIENYEARMRSRLRKMQSNLDMHEPEDREVAPPPPIKSYAPDRPKSALSRGRPGGDSTDSARSARKLKNRKSAYELGREMLGRTFSTKTSATNSSVSTKSTSTNESTSTKATSRSLMSVSSAGGVSATSAGSLARKRLQRPMSVMEGNHRAQTGFNGSMSSLGLRRPQTPSSGVTYHSSHDSKVGLESKETWSSGAVESHNGLGGLHTPKPKKSGFFKKMIESAKTGAASARSSIAAGQVSPSPTPYKSMLPAGVTSISSGSSAARDMGLGGGNSSVDWVQVRRDVNRSNSLSKNERAERRDRCQMLDRPVINPTEELYQTVEGDEDVNGQPVAMPADFQNVNWNLVDKSSRFINSLPPMTNATSLAQGYVCRPYRSDVQRLRAIFTWCSEKVVWEEDVEGGVDTRRIIQSKRGCAEEMAVLVMEMCAAVGIHAEVVRGYLKTPGEALEVDMMPNPNHWWNALIVDEEWRVMDCSLASPTNPRRSLYGKTASQMAESWWFLTRPSEICFSHVPLHAEQQHMCPPLTYDSLLALPCASPAFFRNNLRMVDYDTTLTRLEDLELAHVQFIAPSDVECVAEVEVRAFSKDIDGDYFENGDVVKKRALAQAEWVGGEKRYTIKALLPGDEGYGTLKIYAGKRGLMHSIKDNPHPQAFALPIYHTGKNPPFEFFTRHPTPHAQRHDLYVAQPQCSTLAINNTFVFAIRQHPSSLVSASSGPGAASPVPFNRPSSAMSMTSSQASGSQQSSTYTQKKPAKLAIQSPSGKILRLMRKSEHMISTSGPGGSEAGDGGVWETIIKCGERGIWRGLVLADRSARWCVFAEWNCA